MTIQKRLLFFIVIAFLSVVFTVSCNGKKGSQRSTENEQAAQPQMTWTPVTEGSATLHYHMVVINQPVFTAVQTDEIKLKWTFDPQNPKTSQTILGGIDNGSYFVQIQGNREGAPCFAWFDVPVQLNVIGQYHPGPKCAFSISIEGKALPNTTERGQNCGTEADGVIAQYPAEVLFIPPPTKTIVFPTSLSTSIPVNEWAILNLSLTDVIVSEDSGCQW
ncbi:MAG: hypothetical protein JEZ00_06785 [Anaerolineaceae bacterium]|nr:hypothetical protein [Anaerolineaceae bacterium]